APPRVVCGYEQGGEVGLPHRGRDRRPGGNQGHKGHTGTQRRGRKRRLPQESREESPLRGRGSRRDRGHLPPGELETDPKGCAGPHLCGRRPALEVAPPDVERCLERFPASKPCRVPALPPTLPTVTGTAVINGYGDAFAFTAPGLARDD